MAKGKGGPPLSDRSAPPLSAADAVVHLVVSREAVQNKVFENLLASEGLDNARYSLRADWSDGAEQGRSSDMPRGNAAATPAELRDASKTQAQEALGNGPQKPGANFQPQAAQQDAAPRSGPLYFECDLGPQQLIVILKQIGEKPEAFSKPEVVASLPSNLGAQKDYGYRSSGSGGGMGGFGSGPRGGQLGGGPDQRQIKADDKGLKSLPGATVQSRGAPQAVGGTIPTSPAPAARQQVPPAFGAAKQHVCFVLDVVDRLPAAGRTAGPPPATAATPAAPATKQ